MPRMIDRRPSGGIFAMIVSVIMFTWATFADGLVFSILMSLPMPWTCDNDRDFDSELTKERETSLHINDVRTEAKVQDLFHRHGLSIIRRTPRKLFAVPVLNDLIVTILLLL